MKRIVDDILIISKLDAGLLVITPIAAEPETVVAHAVKMFESEAKAAGVEMNLVIDESYRKLDISWVNLDPTRLLQILINLITNAIKFTRPEDTRSISVRLAASAARPQVSQDGVEYVRTETADENAVLQEDWAQGNNVFVQFSVQDTGRGLNDDQKTLLFTRFSQASPRTHIHYGGSGLGLFISRNLAEMHGGAIGFSSEYGKGSNFSFYVKARRSSPPTLARRGSMAFLDSKRISESKITGHNTRPDFIRQASDVLEAPEKPVGTAQLPPEQTNLLCELTDTLRVLVVEDNLVNQRVLAKQLRNLGCVVDVANHGAEAIDFLQNTAYWNGSTVADEEHDLSAILMDWEMPVMDGLTAVKKIREYEKEGMLKGHVPVIAVTANVRQQQISEAMDAGMDDVVSKPFRVRELLERIRTLISGLPP
jgi:CheY-like chemotaxis protein